MSAHETRTVGNGAHGIRRATATGERKAAGEGRRRARVVVAGETLFRQLTEKAIVGIYVIQDGLMAYVNQSFATSFGYEPDEVIGRLAPRDLVHPDDVARVMEKLTARLSGAEDAEPSAYIGVRKDGSQISMEVYGQAIDYLGKPAVLGTMIDVTRRMAAEAEREEAQAELRAVADSTSDLIWSVDPVKFGLLWFNRGLADYFLGERGISLKVGDAPESLFPTEQFVQIWHNFYGRALREGPFTADYRVFSGTRILQVSLSPVLRNEAVFGISVFGKDVTEQRRAAEALRQSEERLRALIEQAPVAISVSRDGVGLYANRKFIELVGLEVTEEAVGRPIVEYFAPEYRAESRERTRRRELGLPVDIEFESVFMRRDGTCIPIRAAVEQIHLPDGKADIAFVTDITDQMASETERARLAVAVEKAADRAALEERDRLSRELHDGLAQDLWLAKLKAGGLKTVAGTDPEAAQILDELNGAIDFAMADARRAVKALRFGGSGFGLSMFELLRDDIMDFSDRFGLPVELACEHELPYLPPRSQAEILRIVQEALTNVRKHADATLVNVRADVLDGFFSVTIRDNGLGFPARAAPSGHIGLISMHERAALLGGSLAVASRPSEGTTVTLRIPLVDSTDRPRKPLRASSQPTLGAGGTKGL